MASFRRAHDNATTSPLRPPDSHCHDKHVPPGAVSSSGRTCITGPGARISGRVDGLLKLGPPALRGGVGENLLLAPPLCATPGKVASAAGRHRDAASGFEQYLTEFSDGALAREAMGRLMESSLAAGNQAGARAAARDYLERFPEGPHAPLARSLVPQ